MMLPEGFLIVDKPSGWTSHDVVAKLRGILKEKKIGHLGTLDPLATGVLVLAVGRKATKQIQHYMKLDKEYEVEMELGKVSDTYDTEGNVQEMNYDSSILSKKTVQKAVESFWGDSLQMPPAFSAKKIQGKKAYELARAGKEVVLQAVQVHMQGREVKVQFPFVSFTVEVSSGTYIRSLVHDIGQKLGCGAVMTQLRRTRVGPFLLSEACLISDEACLRKVQSSLSL